MARGPEAKLAQRIRRAVVSHAEKVEQPLYIFKMHGGPHSVPGVPDYICCYRGWFVGMEVKTPKNKPTEKQQFHIESIRAAGGFAGVVTSPEEAVGMLATVDSIEDE